MALRNPLVGLTCSGSMNEKFLELPQPCYDNDNSLCDAPSVDMFPRRELVKLFSTFLQLDEDRFQGWIADPKLHHHMEECLRQISETSDQFWAHYWHKHWQAQTSRLAREHLAAYLQEPAYWAAYHITRHFSNLNDGLADCFQIAIAQLDTVLKGFNPEHNSTLKGYARAIFNSTIKGILRQRQETDICSDWGLLRKLSQKRVTEALEQQGFSPDAIAAYTLAWQGFKQLYVPEPGQGTRQLSRPDADTWSAIAQYYNQHCYTATPPLDTVKDGQVLEQWLLKLAQAARAYLYPTVNSADQPVSEGDNRTVAETLPDTKENPPLTKIISEEERQTRQAQQSQMSTVLKQEIGKLNTQQQALLDYYYRQGYTQQAIAQALDTKQYTVSRQLNKIRKLLLSAIAQWSRDTLHISLDSNVLKQMSGALEEWLNFHYDITTETVPSQKAGDER